MPVPHPSPAVLDREFLGIRCRLIDLAASMDRINRHGGAAAGDPRLTQIRRSLEILAGQAADRAERVQMEFSPPYEKRD